MGDVHGQLVEPDDEEARAEEPWVYNVTRGWRRDATLRGLLDTDDYEKTLKMLRFSPWAQYGRIEDGFGIVVYQRPRAGRPQYLIEVDATNGPAERYAYVFADDLPSVMELLKDWIPVAEAAQVSPRPKKWMAGHRIAHLANAVPTAEALRNYVHS